jgi:proline dehydrogenase
MIKFDDTRIAFRDKSDQEIKKALWLFRMIGRPSLVKAGSAMLRGAMSLRFPVAWALKPTVFSHFCGGETIKECRTTINRLGACNIKTILDYSAEGKQSEQDFDATRDQILATITEAKTNPNVPHSVFKVTGLARFALLEKVQATIPLEDQEKQEFERVKKRIHDICSAGAKAGIPVMIDAEESWIQGIIDQMVEEMIFEFNAKEPLIYHTLQMYRHDRLEYRSDFTKRARARNRLPAFKLVRGAYMGKERARAMKNGYPSPIYPDKPATDKAFDEAVKFCLDNYQTMGLCIGTHNEWSCSLAAECIKLKKIPNNHPNIWFSQLLGMSDHISFKLADLNYNVCKYVPYGAIRTVVPYLIRRAEENTSVAGQTPRELYLMKSEMKRRRKK